MKWKRTFNESKAELFSELVNWLVFGWMMASLLSFQKKRLKKLFIQYDWIH